MTYRLDDLGIECPDSPLAVRPCGVYRRPDPRSGCQDRTIIEIWGERVHGDHRDMIAISSVLTRHADARTEIVAWTFLDDALDRRVAVNDTLRHTDRPHLRLT